MAGANTLTGNVNSGTTAIVGATVQLWTTGVAAAQATPTTASTATTDASGHFSLTFNCPAAGTLMYVTASGGQVGAGAANTAINLVSGLGACGSLPASVVVNEFTSAAAAYAFSGFTPTAGSGAVTIQGKSPGLDQAFLTLTNLVIPSTGAFATSTFVTNQTAAHQLLDTVAGAMAACNASTSSGAACVELFSCAQANATFHATGQACTGGTSTAATDTLNAALAITQNAGLVSENTSGSNDGILDLAMTGGAYTPVLGAAPNDYSLPLLFAINGIHGPLAVDGSGHIWLLANDPHPVNPSPAIPNLAVVEIDADGSLISPSLHGWSGGGVSSIQGNDITNLAIDVSGNVWVSGTGPTIAELAPSGAGVPGAPFNAGTGPDDTSGVTIDTNGNAWFASGNTAATVFEFSSAGTNLSGANGYSAGNCPCNGISADPFGNVWVASSGASQYLAEIGPNGTQGSIFGPPGHSTATFYQLASDAAGSLWITDQHDHGIWEFTPSSQTFPSTGTWSALLANIASPGTYPKGIAIDGAGHKWVANQPTSGTQASLTEFSVSGSSNLSPGNGLGWGTLNGAYSVAIDQSGNVWVANGGTAVVEIVGAAAPTRNPISSAIKNGSFAP